MFVCKEWYHINYLISEQYLPLRPVFKEKFLRQKSVYTRSGSNFSPQTEACVTVWFLLVVLSWRKHSSQLD